MVEFAGLVPDAAGCFAEAQFSLLVSRYEGLPNAVLESMAYGVPVVGTAIPGIASLVDDGVDGLLVPAGRRAGARRRHRADQHRPGAPHPAGGRRPGPDAGLAWERCTQRHLERYQELARRPGAARKRGR